MSGFTPRPTPKTSLRISFAAMSDSPRVTLRGFQTADAAAVQRWFNNREATATLMEQRA